jgi:hypothetical protein
MSNYVEIATVTSLADLKNVVTNYHLRRGDRVLLKFDVQAPFGTIFDVAGAELAFSPLMPDHMNLIDVWGEYDAGYVEMEATSPPLAAVLGFIANNWLGIVIAGVVIATIIIAITISLKIAQANPNATVAIVAAAAIIFALFYFGTSTSRGSRST